MISEAFTRTLIMTFRTVQRARGLLGIPNFMEMNVRDCIVIFMKFGIPDNPRARCTVRNVIRSVLVKAAFIMSRCGTVSMELRVLIMLMQWIYDDDG